MSIIASLREKPWLTGPEPAYQHSEARATQLTGLKVMLVVISVLFLLFIIAFLMRSQYSDWQPLAQQANQPLYDRSVLWINTLYLVLASVCIHLAYHYAGNPHSKISRLALFGGGMFYCAFIGGQLLFWQTLYNQGFAVNNNPALSFFFLFTGLHLAHVAVGVVTWLLALRLHLGSVDTTAQQTRLQHYLKMNTLYWHFLLGLWALLFTLLVSKPETYDAIVEFCGLGAGL